jgi:hypothetical protein
MGFIDLHQAVPFLAKKHYLRSNIISQMPGEWRVEGELGCYQLMAISTEGIAH